MKLNSDRSVNACFHSLDDGRRIFVPGGEIGSRAYLIESDEVDERLRRTMRRISRMWFVWIIGFSTILTVGLHVLVRELGLSFPPVLAGLLALCWGVYRVLEWRVTAGLERVPLPSSIGFSATADQRRVLRATVFVTAGLGLFFLAISVPLGDIEGVVIGSALCAFSAWLWWKFPAVPRKN